MMTKHSAQLSKKLDEAISASVQYLLSVWQQDKDKITLHV